MAQGIKVSTTGKGEKHYERYLKLRHKNEFIRFMQRHEFRPKRQRRLLEIYDLLITADNIIPVYTHTMAELALALRKCNVTPLEKYSSARVDITK